MADFRNGCGYFSGLVWLNERTSVAQRVEFTPCEHCGSHDSEANHLVRLMEKNRETLREGLTIAQSEILQKYIDCSEEYLLRMMELAFCEGFCTGGKLAMEMML